MSSYKGEVVTRCEAQPYDLTDVEVVVVSGVWWNPCGHALLRAGRFYFQVDTFRGPPFRLDQAGYERFMSDEHKREVRRTRVVLPDPRAAFNRLEELLTKPWVWGVLPHNCIAFIEAVLQAGGSRDGIISNCPTMEPWGARPPAVPRAYYR